MRILHVVRGLANSSGTTHIVIPLAEEHAKMGHDVELYHVAKPGEVSLEPDPHLVQSRMFGMDVPTRHFGFSSSFAAAMKKQIKTFDVVHVHAVWNFVSWWTMRSARKAGVPYIVAPQGSCDTLAWRLGRPARKMYARLFEIPLLKDAVCIQALTANESRQVKKMGINAPCVIIPNGVHSQVYDCINDPAPLSETLGLPKGERTLLFLSRLHKKKGLDVLAEAFGKLREEMNDVTLVIAGDDAGTGYRSRVENMMNQAGAGDKVHFMGEVRGEEKYRTQLGADAFVLSSYSEGLPVAVVEAMAASLPVVITSGCNLPEVAEAQAGFVVDCDPESVKDALKEMLVDRQRMERMGLNARALVESKFTWQQIAQDLAEVYQDVARVENQA